MNGRGEAVGVATISYTTHSRHLNYGAVLHGWAFQQVLKRLGCESVVVDYLPRALANHHFKWPILDTFRCWRRPGLFARRFLQWLFSTRANLRKWRKFERFIHSELNVTQETYTADSLVAAERLGELDPAVFVAEADVIWKRNARYGMDRGFFLDFPAASGKRKVAYAPSLAKEGFPGAEGERFAAYPKTFSAVSSRERAGAEMLADILGRDVPWLLDPTLLLDSADYAALAKPTSRKGYVLLYSCMKFNANMVREAKRLAERLGKTLVEVGNFGVNRLIFGHEVIDDAGVEEWLGLFMGADCIVCNSFHGICFSVVFGKPFFAFRRADNDWRFTGICGELGLMDRLVDAGGRIPDDAPDVDYGRVKEILAHHVSRSLAFIETNVVGPACLGKAPAADADSKGGAECP